jgi:riboflavin synthase
MFTGIIEDVGKVVLAEHGRLRVSSELIAADAKLGDSISINGVDLTVTAIRGSEMSFDAMPETYRRSNLDDLDRDDPVNLERSTRPMDRLSGHLVRGVVEGTGVLQEARRDGDALVLTYRAPSELLRYVVVKGPICVDGASLTVIDKTDDTFTVSLVQYTQAHTHYVRRRSGDRVNLETDILARYVGELLDRARYAK